MANDQTAQQPVKKPVHLSYDIRNPTPARRVIFDGIEGSMKAITVEGRGGEKKNVTLHADIVKELKQRNRTKENSDLIVTLCDPAATPAKEEVVT